jgi:aminoglycoside phosphotransferase (APT) family kinase protein
MVKHPLLKIHGYSLPQIQQLLVESCDLIDKDVVLETTPLGGWSNINLRGSSQGYEFVLKLPWSISDYETNPYLHLFDLLAFLSKSGLATAPLAIGRFPDRKETPFMLLQYADGIARPSISQATHEELQSLNDTLRRLSQLRPPGLQRYKTPLAYLDEMHWRVVHHEELSSTSADVMNLVSTFRKEYTRFHPIIEALDEWSETTMHGDLWEPNILFQDGGVLLLDFELCCIGDTLYDLAYLMEASDGPPVGSLPNFLSGEILQRTEGLRPVALMSLVSWSLERLIFMDAGLVEPNLTSPQIRRNVIRYSKMKLSRLGLLPT